MDLRMKKYEFKEREILNNNNKIIYIIIVIN